MKLTSKQGRQESEKWISTQIQSHPTYQYHTPGTSFETGTTASTLWVRALGCALKGASEICVWGGFCSLDGLKAPEQNVAACISEGFELRGPPTAPEGMTESRPFQEHLGTAYVLSHVFHKAVLQWQQHPA